MLMDFFINLVLVVWLILGLCCGWINPISSNINGLSNVTDYGIIVLEGDIPFGVRGFSFPPVPVIILDYNADSYVLFHEFGHILYGFGSSEDLADNFAYRCVGYRSVVYE